MLNEFVHRQLKAPYTLHLERLRTPNRPKQTVVLLHGIGSSTVMWHTVADMIPDDVRVVAIDLLGFGKSPNPGWATYDAKTQAKSIIATMILHRIPLKSVIVGHSLGALVAVEVALRAPLYVSQLVLVSPPIYRPSRRKIVATQKEDLLRGMYKILYKNPSNTERALLLARKYYVQRTGAKVASGMNVTAFLAALEAAVINQNTIDHIGGLNIPITIISGTRDPLIVARNLHEIADGAPSITHVRVKKAGHNVVGIMATAVTQQLRALLD